MWSDQARLASAAARAARGDGGSTITSQAAATQASFAASATNPYANRFRRPGGNGQVVGQNVPAVSGSASFTPAHTEAVAALGRSTV